MSTPRTEQRTLVYAVQYDSHAHDYDEVHLLGPEIVWSFACRLPDGVTMLVQPKSSVTSTETRKGYTPPAPHADFEVTPLPYIRAI